MCVGSSGCVNLARSNLLARTGGWGGICACDRAHGWGVDPGHGRRRFLRRQAAHGALWVVAVRVVQDELASRDDCIGATIVHIDGVKQREACVVVLLISRSSYAYA